MKRKWLVATLTLATAVALWQPASYTSASHGASRSDALLETVPVTANLHANELSLSARSAAAIDVQTGRMLYEKNGDDRMLIASITKILTTIIAIESGKDLEGIVTVSNRASGKEGSSIYLKVGEKQKLIDLLYAVMLRSGNDAATAVAEHVGGSEAKFVEMMNAKVEELGLKGSHFANPHGLDAPGHYSTAHDMAIIAAYALRNPTFKKIASTKIKRIPMPGEAWDRKMYNKNKMLNRYDGADGVKTGYTKAAGRTLVSSATRDGRQIAVVTLDAPNDWSDHTKMLDYGFQTYQSALMAEKHKVLKTIPVEDGLKQQVGVMAAEEFSFPIREDEKDKLTHKIEIADDLDAPVITGQQVGEMEIYFEDRLVGEVALVAADDVPEKSFWEKFKSLFTSLISR